MNLNLTSRLANGITAISCKHRLGKRPRRSNLPHSQLRNRSMLRHHRQTIWVTTCHSDISIFHPKEGNRRAQGLESLRPLLYSVIDFPFALLSTFGFTSLSSSTTSIVSFGSPYSFSTSAFAIAGTRALMSSSSFHSLRICS